MENKNNLNFDNDPWAQANAGSTYREKVDTSATVDGNAVISGEVVDPWEQANKNSRVLNDGKKTTEVLDMSPIDGGSEVVEDFIDPDLLRKQRDAELKQAAVVEAAKQSNTVVLKSVEVVEEEIKEEVVKVVEKEIAPLTVEATSIPSIATVIITDPTPEKIELSDPDPLTAKLAEIELETEREIDKEEVVRSVDENNKYMEETNPRVEITVESLAVDPSMFSGKRVATKEVIDNRMDRLFESLGTSQVMALKSGYNAFMTALSTSEIIKLINSRTDNEQALLDMVAAIYNKIHHTTPNMGLSYEKFIENTSLTDLDTLVYGVYKQTFNEKHTYTISCNYCGTENYVDILPNMLTQVKDDKTLADIIKRREEINLIVDEDSRQAISVVSQSKTFRLPN